MAKETQGELLPKETKHETNPAGVMKPDAPGRALTLEEQLTQAQHPATQAAPPSTLSKQQHQTGVTKYTSQDAIVRKLADNVAAVLGNHALAGFEKAYVVANAIGQLKELLTPEYMAPIMKLQGSQLGFLTDNTNGYSEGTVKDCVIDAVLMGLEVTGNQFNIIKGKMYPAKNGYGALLNKVPGLNYQITFAVPRINAEKSSSAVMGKTVWSFNGGEKQTSEMEYAISGAGGFLTPDAAIGKATRKARKWLYETVTGIETSDGDATEYQQATVMESNPLPSKETERLDLLRRDILATKTLTDLLGYDAMVKSTPELQEVYNSQIEKLANTAKQ